MAFQVHLTQRIILHCDVLSAGVFVSCSDHWIDGLNLISFGFLLAELGILLVRLFNEFGDNVFGLLFWLLYWESVKLLHLLSSRLLDFGS